MPSRDFLIRQAILNTMLALFPISVPQIGVGGVLKTYGAENFEWTYPTVRAEYRKLYERETRHAVS